MLLKLKPLLLTSLLLLSGCLKHGLNPDDPYEASNRKIYAFNSALDKVTLKPVSKVYAAVLPAFVRAGVNNFYNNINMLPTIANDLLQGEAVIALRDAWRLLTNSTLGIGGVFDFANHIGLPPHSNDLGITFAKWGNKNSPYIVIPFLGPSTFRDGMSLMFDFALFTPYPYLSPDSLVYGLLILRYIDLRSQMLDTEHLMDEAFDPYTFMRDAYLQHRKFLITGEQPDNGALYVDDTPQKTEPSEFPITSH